MDAYDRQWHRSQSVEGEWSEGQQLTLVAFDGEQPAGFATMGVGLSHDEENEVALNVNVELVYVSPSYRGRGFGLDLSLASGSLLEHFVLAVCRACPEGHTVAPMLSADYFSEGGERFTEHLANSLALLYDLQDQFDLADGVSLERAIVEVGY